ncbi:MAG: hypothetical protein ABJQ71_18450 [Roseibium sp.]
MIRPNNGSKLGFLPDFTNYRPQYWRGIYSALFAAIGFVAITGMVWAAAVFSLDQVEDPYLNQTLSRAFVLHELLDLSDFPTAKVKLLIGSEAQKLEDLLRSLGYLRASVDIIWSQDANEGARLRPKPAELYRIGWIRLVGLPTPFSKEALAALDDFAAQHVGQIATRRKMEIVQAGVHWRLLNASYAKGEITQTDLTIEQQTRTVGLTLTFDPGKKVYLGDIQIQGSKHADVLEQVSTAIVTKGTPYSATAIQKLRELLEQTDLFRRITISLAGDENTDGNTDITVNLDDALYAPVRIQNTKKIGYTLSIITMFLIIIGECFKSSSQRPNSSIKSALSITTAVFYTANITIIIGTIYNMINY